MSLRKPSAFLAAFSSAIGSRKKRWDDCRWRCLCALLPNIDILSSSVEDQIVSALRETDRDGHEARAQGDTCIVGMCHWRGLCAEIRYRAEPAKTILGFLRRQLWALLFQTGCAGPFCVLDGFCRGTCISRLDQQREKAVTPTVAIGARGNGRVVKFSR